MKTRLWCIGHVIWSPHSHFDDAPNVPMLLYCIKSFFFLLLSKDTTPPLPVVSKIYFFFCLFRFSHQPSLYPLLFTKKYQSLILFVERCLISYPPHILLKHKTPSSPSLLVLVTIIFLLYFCTLETYTHGNVFCLWCFMDVFNHCFPSLSGSFLFFKFIGACFFIILFCVGDCYF